MICSSVKRLRLMFWSSQWARTNFKLDYPRGATSIDPEERTHRFYKMFIAPSLFGEWMLVREWGRIDSPGRVRSDRFDNPGAALLALQKVGRDKLRRGYTMRHPAYRSSRVPYIGDTLSRHRYSYSQELM